MDKIISYYFSIGYRYKGISASKCDVAGVTAEQGNATIATSHKQNSTERRRERESERKIKTSLLGFIISGKIITLQVKTLQVAVQSCPVDTKLASSG